MTDVEEVTSLLFSYCHAYDAGDVQRLRSLWTEEAVMVTARGEQPHEALERLAEGAPAWKGKGRHLVHNPLVRVHGETAEFSAYWTVVGLPAEGPTLAGTGSYRGTAAKTPRGWRITRFGIEAIVMDRARLGPGSSSNG